ncbi:ferredoxin [Salipaludibacillus keqinensis]|uniref:Ferredoxin n=1 Tax=Salipaludibacillus keqinensis TaxID=2045207 RepID=A0A323TQZ5_9BACI|nr:(2Fe-2S) ferredoxin domain-containing protein [Salipaludibacillus keqinensis]PYZ91745.1 ferredoxin [Salipaludibacillus keqinensis]
MASRNIQYTTHHLLLCNGKSCKKGGAKALHKAIQREISTNGLKQSIQTTRTRCLERCKDRCVVVDYPDGTWYHALSEEDAPTLINTLRSERLWSEKISHRMTNDESAHQKKSKKKKK